TLTDAELKQLAAFRLDVVKSQRALRERQAELDTAQRTFAAAKRAADSSGAKVSPALKTQIAAVEKELPDITREMGTANAGRGGGGGGGGGGGAAGGGAPAGGGRGGRGGGRGAAPAGGTPPAGNAAPPGGQPAGGGAGASDQEQNPTAPTTPQTLQARLQT